MISTVTYSGDGATRIFPVSFEILGEEYVKIFIDDDAVIDRTTYDIINNSIVFLEDSVPATGVDNIVIVVASSASELGDMDAPPSAIGLVLDNLDNINIVASNINLLINTANGEYIVSGLPETGALGDLAVNVLNGKIYEYKATGWVVVATSAEGGGSGEGTAPIVPVEPLPEYGQEGEFRYNTADGKFYAFINGEWQYALGSPSPTDTYGIAVYATNPTENLVEGMVIFNTTENKLLKYVSGSWVQVIEPIETGQAVADASITTAKFAAGLTPIEIVDTLPNTNNFVGRTVVLTTNGKLYRYSGTAFTSAVPAADLTGTIGVTQIADDAITTAKLAAGAVTANEILANSITADNIAFNTITGAVISAGAINTAQLAVGAVRADNIYANAVTADKILANSITGDKIQANSIMGDRIIANSLDAGKIKAGTISTEQLGVGCVRANQIDSYAITASKLSVDALDGKNANFNGTRYVTEGGLNCALIAKNSANNTGSCGGYFVGYAQGAVGVGLGSGHGGYCYSLGVGAGVVGTGSATAGSHGIIGVSSNASNYGLYTGGKCFAGGGYTPFTGSHIAYGVEDYTEGDIVEIIDSWLVNVNQSYSKIKLSTKYKSNKAFGVVSTVQSDVITKLSQYEALLESNPFAKIKEAVVFKEEFKPYIDDLVNNKYKEVTVNALGEGGINVCSQGGNISIGDYICTSDIKGKGMKQDDDLLHNYTVAKALESVDWSKETATTKMIACTYHAG